MKPNTTPTACELCGETGDLKTVAFICGGRVFDGPICPTCRTCEDCGQELTVVERDNGGPYVACGCDRCPGCGSRPGEGQTPGCADPDGCGFGNAPKAVR